MSIETLNNNDPFAVTDEQPQVKSPEIQTNNNDAALLNLDKRDPFVEDDIAQVNPPKNDKGPKSDAILNLNNLDPFAEEDEVEEQNNIKATKTQDYIHIRIQQRNGRKSLTTIQGLPVKFDKKKIIAAVKKKLACNGTIISDTVMGEVIQLQGDQRKNFREFLIAKKGGLGLKPETIKVHGF